MATDPTNPTAPSEPTMPSAPASPAPVASPPRIDLDTIFGIADLALSVIASAVGAGKVATDFNIADALLKITQAGYRAYQQHTGRALDPSLLKPETPVP